MAVCKPGRESSPGTKFADTYISDFQPLELWEINVCCFKMFSLWYFVMARGKTRTPATPEFCVCSLGHYVVTLNDKRFSLSVLICCCHFFCYVIISLLTFFIWVILLGNNVSFWHPDSSSISSGTIR